MKVYFQTVINCFPRYLVNCRFSTCIIVVTNLFCIVLEVDQGFSTGIGRWLQGLKLETSASDPIGFRCQLSSQRRAPWRYCLSYFQRPCRITFDFGLWLTLDLFTIGFACTCLCSFGSELAQLHSSYLLRQAAQPQEHVAVTVSYCIDQASSHLLFAGFGPGIYHQVLLACSKRE